MCLSHVRYNCQDRLAGDLPAALDSNDVLRYHLWPLEAVEASSLSESKIAKTDQYNPEYQQTGTETLPVDLTTNIRGLYQHILVLEYSLSQVVYNLNLLL